MVAAKVSNSEVFTDVALHIQDLVLGNPCVEKVLGGLAAYAADRLSSRGGELSCGISLVRSRKSSTAAGSDPLARLMVRLEESRGQGPGLAASEGKAAVRIPDLRLEERWPEYTAAAAGRGFLSVLSVPLFLERPSRAVLILYSRLPNAFREAGVERAEAFAEQASRGLQLVLKMARLQDTRDELKAAMESRTVIDLATGAIMARHKCSQNAAFKVLLRASNTRNIKLHDVASQVVATLSGSSGAATHFDE
ncbi:MAG TPA: GAF and ANTAR domain-containing protein [Arthrobacter sp.]|nr:GAF and ANTAR domain-containing protein [Arthrobacter sp.]